MALAENDVCKHVLSDHSCAADFPHLQVNATDTTSQQPGTFGATAQPPDEAIGGMSPGAVLMWVAPVAPRSPDSNEMLFRMTPAGAVPAGSWPTFAKAGNWERGGAVQVMAHAPCAPLPCCRPALARRLVRGHMLDA